MATVTWHWLTYENGMDHAVSGELLAAVRHSMANADPPGIPKAEDTISELPIDQPGLVYADRPSVSISFRGIALEIPCEHPRAFLEQWRARGADVVLGRAFYRFTGHPWRCLVVDPEQREALLGILAAQVEDAERRAEAFHADLDTPSQVLRDYNQRVHGVSPDDPIYGADPRVRSRSPRDN